MQLLNYAIASVIAYSGIAAGMMLIFMGPEEKKDGKRYFVIMQMAIIVLVSFFLLYFSRLRISYLLTAAALLLTSFLRVKDEIKKQHLVYMLLGIAFYMSSENIKLCLTESSLIFIYGMPTGSLICNSKKKLKSIGMVLAYSHFILLSIALALLF